MAAGEPEPGRALLEFVEPLIYRSSLDFRAVEAVSETRQRISEKMASKRGARSGLDVKLTPGGIRDIEFLVQCLQRLHGGREQWVRHGGTMFALFRLRDKGLLSGAEYARLAAAYTFLRHLEHRLQMVDDRQTHALPSDAESLNALARKMPTDGGETLDGEALRLKLGQHLAAVRELYERVIYAQKPMYYTAPEPAALEEEAEPAAPSSNLTRFLDQRAPRLAEVVSAASLHRGRDRFEHFLEKAFAAPELLERLNADSELAAFLLDFYEHSHYFSDQLLRYPELLDEFRQDFQPPEPGELADGASLRRFYRRQMLRIQSESVLRAAPISRHWPRPRR